MRTWPLAKAALTLVALAALGFALSWYPSGAAQADIVAAAGTSQPPEIHLRIQGPEQFLLGSVTTDRAGLRAAVRQRLAETCDRAVVRLEGVDGTTMATVDHVHNTLRDLGLFRVVYANEAGAEVPLVLPPESVTSQLAQLRQSDIAQVLIGAPGTATLDGSPVPARLLGDMIARRLAENPHLIVSIRPVAGTTYDDFLQVTRLIQAAGAPRIHVANVEAGD